MRNMTESQMYCTCCGKKNIPVQRKIGKEREPGHLKRMYCIHCGKETNMVEIRPFGSKYTLEWFQYEYAYGNFKNGVRMIPLNEFKTMIHNKRKKGADINESLNNDDRDSREREEHLCEENPGA